MNLQCNEIIFFSPSPAHKLPGSSTRNELYLKSVLSPYHKNYTPLSATPTGFTPMYRTPGRNIGSSPIVKETPETAKQHHFVTPNRLGPKNPFEYEVEHLEGNVFMSPGVFSLPGSTPASDEKVLLKLFEAIYLFLIDTLKYSQS